MTTSDVGEAPLEPAQLLEHALAVDAGQRPEVEQDDLAAQLPRASGPATPIQPPLAVELGRAHAHAVHAQGRSGHAARAARCDSRRAARAARRRRGPGGARSASQAEYEVAAHSAASTARALAGRDGGQLAGEHAADLGPLDRPEAFERRVDATALNGSISSAPRRTGAIHS